MADSWLRKRKGAVETGSQFRAWWLNSFQGYKILEEKLLPKKNFLGRISYGRTWLLVPREHEE
jgi:hypothetical protein